jgi:hypothetical protein
MTEGGDVDIAQISCVVAATEIRGLLWPASFPLSLCMRDRESNSESQERRAGSLELFEQDSSRRTLVDARLVKTMFLCRHETDRSGTIFRIAGKRMNPVASGESFGDHLEGIRSSIQDPFQPRG